ncbi:MAG TPA: DUF4349 domain-containing protein [Anaerolineales bacterium]|nr:DUF4349 domain-containing protein [Anaerolineales bacterium]
MKKKLFVLVFLLLTFVLAACSVNAVAQPAMEEEGFYAGDVAAGVSAEYVEYETSEDVASLDLPDAPPERMIIKNASLDIVVSDPAQTMDEIAQLAESLDGYVVSSRLYQRYLDGGGTAPQANITVRVPAESLDDALKAIEDEAGTVENKIITSDDITQDYTDLASQLRNLEAAEAQLTEIMDAATDTDEVLNVYNQLVRVREQIEIIKGRMRYYEQSVALSKIKVSIIADEAVQPLQIGGWQPAGVAKDAIETMIRTLQFIADAGIWFVLCVLPVGLLIGLPLYFVVRWVMRIRKRKKEEQITASPAGDETPSAKGA